MAHSPLKVDMAMQGTKRARSQESNDSLASSSVSDLGASGHTSLTSFLCQHRSEIRKKFEELEWLQRDRLAAGLLANDPSHPWALETDPRVKARNRYLNVQAWANSRIHLKVPVGECDFINASPIILKGSNTGNETRYIATQGPKDKQLTHFWHMVFHETKEVAVIIMLTRTTESGREKCAQYFPLDAENSSMELQVEPDNPFVNDEDHGKVDNNTLGRITLRDYSYDEPCRSEIRRLELTMGSQSKVVWHFLFAGWVDYSKPEGADRVALLHLIKKSASKCSPDNPRVVHCSAGVGRTGTFIALDHLLRELESGELLKLTEPDVDPVFETVNQLREQRMTMVHNEMQLQFIYEVLGERAEWILSQRKTTGGGDVSNGGASNLRSSEAAKPLKEFDLEISTKPELEPVPDRVFNPDKE